MSFMDSLKERSLKTGGTGETLKERAIKRIGKQIEILKAPDFNNHGVKDEKNNIMKSWWNPDGTYLSCKLGKRNLLPEDNAIRCKDVAEAIQTLEDYRTNLINNEESLIKRLEEVEAGGEDGDDDDEEKKD